MTALPTFLSAAAMAWRRCARLHVALPACLLLVSMLAPAAADELEVGRRIYEEGVLSSGAPLTGQREQTLTVSGSEAACVRCHRRSGMGSVEGTILVAPISGTYLLNLSQKARATMDPHVGKLMNQYHPPYTDAALAEAIRTGVNNSGRLMTSVMPQYDSLPEADLKALVVYLKQLSTKWSPGVTGDRIRLATVVTPGVDAATRKLFLDMVRTAVTQKNGATLQGRRHMVSPAEMLLRTERKWDLDVWELSGAPDTWADQLDAHYRQQPVFAIASGLAADTWQPVHDFCERQRVPCWFPVVDLVPQPAPGHGGYSLYFTRGVALEADILASVLRDMPGGTVKRVVQVWRDDAVGRGAAQAMARAMEGSGIEVSDRILRDSDNGSALRSTLQRTRGTDALVFWLRPADVAALGDMAPPTAAKVYFSGRLASADGGFPAAWKGAARFVYPYELPDKRALNLAYFRAWLKSRKMPLVDEVRQSEVYFALTFLTDTLAEMLDNLYRDYLVERAEDMINRREVGRAEEEARDRPHLGYRGRYAGNRESGGVAPPEVVAPAPVAVGHSQSTTIYPRLTLGPGQRHASKGAYIVRFAGHDSDALVTETEWTLP